MFLNNFLDVGKNHVNVKTPKSYITRMEFEKICSILLNMFDVILHMF